MFYKTHLKVTCKIRKRFFTRVLYNKVLPELAPEEFMLTINIIQDINHHWAPLLPTRLFTLSPRYLFPQRKERTRLTVAG